MPNTNRVLKKIFLEKEVLEVSFFLEREGVFKNMVLLETSHAVNRVEFKR
jgi:hypothetical protein